MGYFPKSKINVLETSGGDFIIKGSDRPYTGKYIATSDNKYYAGSNPSKLGIELEKAQPGEGSNMGNDRNVKIYNILKKQKHIFLKGRKSADSKKPPPTEDDYKRGFFVRYFMKKVNDHSYIEIDKKTYDDFYNENDYNLFTVGSLQWALIGDVRKVNRKTLNRLEQSHSDISLLFFILDEYSTPALQEGLSTRGGELYYKDGREYTGHYHIHPVMGPIEGSIPEGVSLETPSITPILGRTYPDDSNIPVNLPASYALPVGEAHEQNQNCVGCYFFHKNVCHKWKASVRATYWCQSFIIMKQELDYANEFKSARNEDEAQRNRIIKKIEEDFQERGNFNQNELQQAIDQALIEAGLETPATLRLKNSIRDAEYIPPENQVGKSSIIIPPPIEPEEPQIQSIEEYFDTYGIDPMAQETLRLEELESKRQTLLNKIRMERIEAIKGALLYEGNPVFNTNFYPGTTTGYIRYLVKGLARKQYFSRDANGFNYTKAKAIEENDFEAIQPPTHILENSMESSVYLEELRPYDIQISQYPGFEGHLKLMTSNPPVVTAEQRREGDEQRIYLRSLRKELKKYKTMKLPYYLQQNT